MVVGGGVPPTICAEHSQTQPQPHAWSHVDFLGPQLSGSVIHGGAKATNDVFSRRWIGLRSIKPDFNRHDIHVM